MNYRSCYYCTVGFFVVLKFREWLIFSFLGFYFHEYICQKLSAAMDSAFFEGLNFMNDQQLQNMRNLRTSKKPTIRYCLYEVIMV